MTHQIKIVKTELDIVEQEKETNTTALTRKKLLKCQVCKYSVSTNTVIKRHMNIKHKHRSKTPEKKRCLIAEESVKLVSSSPSGNIFDPILDFEPIEPVYEYNISLTALPHSFVISTNNSRILHVR